MSEQPGQWHPSPDVKDPLFEAGYQFVDRNAHTADAIAYPPAWYGWMVRLAFWEGARWARERAFTPDERAVLDAAVTWGDNAEEVRLVKGCNGRWRREQESRAQLLAVARLLARERRGGGDEIDFSCRVCSKQCDSAPPKPERAVCEDHCEDHEYQYERGDRTWYCKHCGKERERDWDD